MMEMGCKKFAIKAFKNLFTQLRCHTLIYFFLCEGQVTLAVAPKTKGKEKATGETSVFVRVCVCVRETHHRRLPIIMLS